VYKRQERKCEQKEFLPRAAYHNGGGDCSVCCHFLYLGRFLSGCAKYLLKEA
jgi:hypothetical protein